MVDRGRQYLLLADEELISLAGQGEAQAFAMLYDRHSRPAYSLAYRMMGEKQAAEDLLQDALLKVWRAAASYRPERGSVPAEQLKILELAYFSGYTHVEISELLGVPLGTVKGRMRLGLKKVKDYFDAQHMAVPR